VSRNALVALAAFLILLSTPVCRGRADEAALVATGSSQSIQNAEANAFHLSRLRDLEMVSRFHEARLLVRVPSRAPGYYVHGVPSDYRYLRPWTKLFLDRVSREFDARFHQPLRVTSMLRTVRLQRHLSRTNPNAADAIGADRSSHLTGATLDISKHGMNSREQRWMRNVLFQLKSAGYLYAIEEFQEPCFHVMVYPTYRRYVAGVTRRAGEEQEGN
jgi:Family of unknown function (DUF5715)